MKRILIVEDTWTEYEDLRMRLENEGFVLGEFTKSYEGAKTQIESFGPHLILLDIDLFGPLNGFDVAELIDAKYGIPYIFLSSYSHREFREKALKTKAKNFLVKQKPISTDQLLVAIEFAFEEAEKSQLEHSGLWVLPMPKRDKGGKLLRDENDQRIQEKPALKFENVVKIVRGQGDLHHKIIFEIHDGSQYCHPKPLSRINELIPEDFIRVERGIIINMNYIKSRISRRLLNVNGQQIPIGKKYLERVNAILKKKFLDL